MEIEVLNPIHPGFYESIVTPYDLEERELEFLCEDYDNLEKILKDNDIEIQFDNKEYETKVSGEINNLFIEKINDEIKYLLDIENLLGKKTKEDLDSPRFYNFETDRSFFTAEVDDQQFKKFIDYMFKERRDELSETIIDRFTSSSGFISFYSNDIEEWEEKKYKFDHNELETIFMTLLDGEDYTEEIYEIASNVFGEIDIWFAWNEKRYSYGKFIEIIKS